MENLHFTVIIPTKDRAQYLFHTLRTCTNQEYKNLEIIVSDDGSIDNTKEVVMEAALKDSRIRYITPGAGVGMLDNFEYALDHVKPGFVIALGGDDGLLPYSIVRMHKYLVETGLELLAWPTATYFYEKTKIENGQLIFPLIKSKSNNGLRIINSKDYLERQSKNLNYISDIESPMIYVKGVVSTKMVNRVRNRSKDGRFYSCSTPDGYSGIVLAGEVDNYAFSLEPLTIHGVSPTSQGLGYLSNNELAKKQSDDFFKKANNNPMHVELASQPYSPLISLMTADFLLTARDLPGWPGKFPPINYKSLLSKGISELQDGLFPEDRISRELNILYKIAEQKGLEKYFINKLNKTKRNARRPLEGNAISPRLLYIDALHYKIYNIFDASYVAHFYYQIVPNLKFGVFKDMLKNSIIYRSLSLIRKKKLSHIYEETKV